MLTDARIRRFSRQILLRDVGGAGQAKLLGACVRVPLLDERGRSCAMWLARAGIGALALPDDRTPAPACDPSGLLLASDAGRPIIEAVRERLRFHAPHLAFRNGADAEAEAGGPDAALAAIRHILSVV